MSVKAFLVGVSEYSNSEENLEFCKNDIVAMAFALHRGLKVNLNDIFICGLLDDTSTCHFKDKLKHLSTVVNEDDILFFYFSGHGGTIDNEHYLAFTDTNLKTQKILEDFENIKSKTKIIIIDSCQSGNFILNNKLPLNIDEAVNEFASKGYAVFASSSSSQSSHNHPNENMSLYTNIFCKVLLEKTLIKEGRISLHEISRNISFYMDILNKNYPDRYQTVIFRKSIIGNIYFEVEEYTSIKSDNRVSIEHKDYLLYSIEPQHNSNHKKYLATVILKTPFANTTIFEIAKNINNFLLTFEKYNNDISKKFFLNKPTNIIYIFFGYNENDINNGNYICSTFWCDNSQDKAYFYKTNNKDESIYDDIKLTFFSTYNFELSNFDNSSDNLTLLIKELRFKLVCSAEKLIIQFNEYKNKTITEINFSSQIQCLVAEIINYDSIILELPDFPSDIFLWATANTSLFTSINNMASVYKKLSSNRTSENRKSLMNIYIDEYYSDLKKIEILEKNNS